MIAEQEIKALTDRETEILTLVNQGKKNKTIAEELEITLGTVKKVKNRLKSKLGHEVVNPHAVQKSPGAEHVPRISRENIKQILSEAEYEVFLEMEKAKMSNALIAKNTNRTRGSVKVLREKIREKIGPNPEKYFYKGFVELIENNDELETKKCKDCARYMGTTHNNGSTSIMCQIKGTVTFPSSENYSCEWHKTYIAKKWHEKDLLEERLKDQGFLDMAYNMYGPEKSPLVNDEDTHSQTNGQLDTEEMLKAGINQLGHMNILLTKRAKHFATMAAMKRYAVIPISTLDLRIGSFKSKDIKQDGKTKYKMIYPVKNFLEQNRIKALKIEPDIDEEGNRFSVGYYVVKNPYHVKQLTALMLNEINISIPENGTLEIEFSQKTEIQGVNCKKENGTKKQLNLDIQIAQKKHTIEFDCETGHYDIDITLGTKNNSKSNITLSYKIMIVNDNGQPKVSRQTING